MKIVDFGDCPHAIANHTDIEKIHRSAVKACSHGRQRQLLHLRMRMFVRESFVAATVAPCEWALKAVQLKEDAVFTDVLLT